MPLRPMCNYSFMNGRRLLLWILCSGLLPVREKAGFPLLNEAKDPIERREENLKIFREKRDLLFKADTHSLLKETDRKRFRVFFLLHD